MNTKLNGRITRFVYLEFIFGKLIEIKEMMEDNGYVELEKII